MANRQYIGARYVPVFADPLQWDNTRVYEPLTMVQNQGDTYISRTAVPIGIDILNDDYWVFLTNWNAQIEQYREEVQQYDSRITANADDIDALEAIIPKSDFDSTNTVKKYISENADDIDALEGILPKSEFDSTNTVKKYIDAEISGEKNARENADETLQENIDSLKQLIENNTLDEVIEAADPILRYTYSTGASGSSVYFTISDVDWYAYTTAQTTSGGVEAGCQVHIINMVSKTEVASVSLNAVSGHANSMCYFDEKLYILGSAVDPLMYIIDVSNPNNASIDSSISMQNFAQRHNINDYWFSVMKIEDGFYIAHMESGQIWITDDNVSNEELVCDITVNRYTDGIPQFVTYSAKHKAFIFIWSNRIEWYDTNGNLIKTQHFAYQYGFICCDEIESVCVVEDDVYFSNATLPLQLSGNVLDTTVLPPYTHVSTLWHFNLQTGAQIAAHPKFNSGEFFVEINNTVDPLPLTNFNYETGTIASRRVKLKYAQDLRAVRYVAQDMVLNIQVTSDILDQIITLYGSTYTNLNGHKFAGVYVNEGQHFITGYRTAYTDSPLATMALFGTISGDKTLIRQEGGEIRLGDGGNAPTVIANKKILSQRFALTCMSPLDYEGGLSNIGTWGTSLALGNNLS